jgi:hypothetical protein
MAARPVSKEELDRTLAVFEKHGTIKGAAEELGIERRTVRDRLRSIGKYKKGPIARGTVHGTKTEKAELPSRGVKRYILTSAQNNTKVHQAVWDSLLTLAKHYRAEILVGTFSYNQNHYGALSVKRGKKNEYQRELWYDPQLTDYLNDDRKELGKGLVWCGEYNALPTNVNPLAGLESYTQRQSAIFPHAKMAMRSIPTMQGEGTKLNYTTGTVTKRNYIQKREGVIAEHHHVYGGLLVEVNTDGNWWVRQLNAESDGTIQDLDVVVKGNEVTTGNAIEAVTWGDLHTTWIDEEVKRVSLEMLDELKPKFQFFHDVLKGWTINRHAINKHKPHYRFHAWLRGYHRFEQELVDTVKVLDEYERPGTRSVAVDSNHDNPWIQNWLEQYEYRHDPANAEFFLDAQRHMYAEIRAGKMARDVNMLEWCLRQKGYKFPTKFLIADESFLICNRKIECGMHGHLGPNGRFATPDNLSKMGRKANTAHTHSAGIYNGLYVAGTSSKMRWTYNTGPSSWSHSHIVTYPNGKRTIITIYNGSWRA